MKKTQVWILFILLAAGLSYAGFIYKNRTETINEINDNSNASSQVQQVPSSSSVQEQIIEEPSYSIDSQVLTTLDRTIYPIPVTGSGVKIYPSDIPKFDEYGYGKWQFSGGMDYIKRFDLMGSGYEYTGVNPVAKLLKFYTMSDIHLIDEESPAQAIAFGYKGGNSSAYAPQMLYTTQVLDAAVQTINALNKKEPIDFVISLGDDINNNQYNELRWFIDVLDGKVINPDSGKKDDPISGPHNDYQDEFKAAGLDKTIPWYQTLGNHDRFGMGSYPVDDYIRPFYTGENVLDLGSVFSDPLGVKSRGMYNGVIDGSTEFGTVTGAGPVSGFNMPPKVISDPNRHTLSSKKWMNEFFNTTSKLIGHGFTKQNIENDFASYTFEPKSDIPLRVLVLNDTQNDTNFDLHEHGYLDQEQYEWLISELAKGQAEGKLMIIAAHIPLQIIGLKDKSYIKSKSLVQELNKYPNLILWIAGHRHRNVVTARPSSDISHPENGFWEVETSSLKDFPQQMRDFDIVRNSDSSISIFTKNIDVAVKEGSLAAKSRSYSIAAMQIFHEGITLPPTGVYNAQLFKKLTPEMQSRIQNLGTEIKK